MRRSILPWAALCASVGITLGVAAFIDQTARTRDETRFHLAVQTARDSIDGRLESYSLLLRSAAAFLAADPAATAEDFHRYVDRLDLRERHVGVQGLFFVRLFHRAEADAVEADLAARGFPVRVWPDGGHEVRSAIVWLEPQEGPNRRVAGFDMMADPVRREAMERARDQGRPALSGKIALLQEEEPNPQAGFILFAPVYRGGATPEGREARREALLGWVSSAFRADDLFTGLFGREARPVLDFEVYDGNQVEPRSLLHNKPVIAAKGALREEQRLEVAGRTWTLVFASLGSLASDSVRTLLPGVLLVGAIVSLLFFFLTRREALARRRIDETAVELTRSLAGRQLVEERLREEGRVSDTLRKLGISLAAELDETRLTQLITDEATSLTGAGFGAFFHTVQGASGEAVHLYTLSGIDRAAFAGFSVPRNTLLFGPTLRGFSKYSLMAKWRSGIFP